jgi:large repetitive protein
MTQQPDLTIPFDASVVDEEALRALRAVQRAVPVGDGGASGNLVGGTEAVAAFGMVPGAPSGGASAATGGIAPLAEIQAAKPIDVALVRPETPPRSGLPMEIRRAIADAPEIAPTLVRSSASVAKAGAVAGSSSAPPSATTAPFEPAMPTERPSDREDQPVVALPSVDQPTPGEPQPEEPRDTMASPPRVQVADATGEEDQPIALDLTAVLGDTDGSEALSITIFGVPEGASLTHGTRQPDGSWTVSPADLAHLAFIPPTNFSGTVSLRLQATSQELNGSTAIVNTPFQVQVHAVADAPDVTVADARGTEDMPVNLSGLGGALRDTDGSESLSFVLSGVPEGATLSAGTNLGGGRWALTEAQLTGLTLNPPANASGTYTLRLEAIAIENAGDSKASTSASFTVTLDTVVDPGAISGTNTGDEDEWIRLQPNFFTPDKDGSETWSDTTTVSNVPKSAVLSHGKELEPGIWEVPTAALQAGDVSIKPPVNSDQDFELKLTATLADTANSRSESREVTGTHGVIVTAVADMPVTTVKDVEGWEDRAIALDLTANLKDLDDSETLSVLILNVPKDSTLSAGKKNADGDWELTPAELKGLTIKPGLNFSGTIDLTLQATSHESENGATATARSSFKVHVDGMANAPHVDALDVSGQEDDPITLKLSAAPNDADGSEELYAVTITGLEPGTTLSHGEKLSASSWKLDPADLADLVLTPLENFSGTMNLTVHVTSRELANGAVATTDVPFKVLVNAVADKPDVEAENVDGKEDKAISLKLGAELTDTDTSEVLSVRILNVPEGAELSHGKCVEKGIWVVDPKDLGHLTITPPRDFSGTITLTLEATARETSNGSFETNSTSFEVKVAAVADAPEITAGGASGDEDSTVPLKLSANVTDASEEISSVIISGVPDNFSLTHGIQISTGTWRIEPAELSSVGIVPPKNYSGTFDLTVEVKSRETSNASEATSTKKFPVHFEAVPDEPTVSAENASGTEDEWLALDIKAALTDTDESEVLTIVIENLSKGTRLSAGKENSDGSWTLTPAEIKDLKMLPPEDWSGTETVTVLAHSRETSNDLLATSRTTFDLQVKAVVDAPEITAKDLSGDEDTAISLNLKVNLADTDGSETLSVIISGVPVGATLSPSATFLGGDSWSVKPEDVKDLKLRPPHDFSGDIKLTVHATSRESNGDEALTEKSFTLTVRPVADAPTVKVENAQGTEDAPVELKGLGGGLCDTDGSESLSFEISNVPEGATLSAGIDLGHGRWALTEAELTGLTMTPPPNASGTYTLTLTAIATEGVNGSKATTPATFTVTLDAVVDPGTIAGTSTGTEDEWIVVQPTFATPDTDGSEEWSTTTIISGVPKGAVLRGGTELETGIWRVSTAALQAGEVSIKPPVNSDEGFELTLTTTLTDTANGTGQSREVTGTHEVIVTAVADAPEVTAEHVAGQEDEAIVLDLTAVLTDLDESETLSVLLLNVPQGATLSAGERNADGHWELTAAELEGLTLTPPRDFSGTLDLTIRATAREKANGHEATTEAEFKVTVHAVADAPLAEAGDVTGKEDHSIALDLSAELSKVDNSGHISSVIVSGVPNGFTLSHSTPLEGDRWEVPVDKLSEVQLTPPRDWNGTLQLTLHATSMEPTSNSTATASAPFTVTITPVNDAPELALTAPSHSDAGTPAVSAIGSVQAHDIDSTYLGGATVTLTGGHSGDRLEFEGFALREQNGHLMIGNTGIEVVGGGYASHAGTLTLRGDATPDIYSTVLQSLVLESGDATGLAAGSRSIAVTLFDSEGAASTPKAIEVIVDEPPLALIGAYGLMAAADTGTSQDLSGSDILLMMADGMIDASHGAGEAWTDQIDMGGTPSEPAPHQPIELDQPAPDHVQPIDNLQIEAARTHWS